MTNTDSNAEDNEGLGSRFGLFVRTSLSILRDRPLLLLFPVPGAILARLILLGSPGAALSNLSLTQLLPIILIQIFLNQAQDLAVVFSVLNHLRGRRIGFGVAIAKIFALIRPLLGLVFLLGFTQILIGQSTGAILFIALLIPIAWAYASIFVLPILVDKDTPIHVAIKLSFSMANRLWRDVLMFLAFMAALTLVIANITGAVTEMGSQGEPELNRAIFMASIVSFPFEILLTIFGAILRSVTYDFHQDSELT